MIKEIFNTVLFVPLYNALVALIDIAPYSSVALAVVALTIVVKLILFPLSISSVRTQLKMKIIQKPLKDIQKKYKDNREELGRKMLELYRENNINPFAGFFLILIQIPVIFALYWVFARGGLPTINPDLLYSFIPFPEYANMNIFGFINVGESKSIFLAFLAAITQFFQARFSFPKPEPRKKGEQSFQDDLMRGMSVQVKYVLPLIIFGISYTLISVVALYWTVSNLFGIAQELYVRKHIRKDDDKGKDKSNDDKKELVEAVKV